ncbi:MAG: signal peptide peptidase SppA [Fibromonadaceae bacterium]|jgi:protease-4|nr:signal peptide peptidase SppA [Fibromonadaceae bacterium]
MPFFLIAFFISTSVAAVSGESRFASLSQNAGMQGNPAALGAFESPGAIFGYEKFTANTHGQNLDNFIFGFWGNESGAYFDWTSGENGYDRSEWSYINSFSNISRSLFFGSRLSVARISLENGTAFSWSPGFIMRPYYFSLGFWSEHALQYGFYQNRTQNVGLSIRPVNAITFSWNAKINDYKQLKHFSSQVEQNLLLELEAYNLILALEFPFVEPNNNGEFRISLSAELGSHLNSSFVWANSSLAQAAKNTSSNMNFRKFNIIMHSAFNQNVLENVNMVRVPLGSIYEKNNEWSILGEKGADLEMLRNTIYLLEKSDAEVVLFDFSNYSGSLSISQEIRRGISSLRSKGKRVAAYTNDFRPSVIFAATAANKVILQPSAFVDFKGFSSEVLYYKGLLDWVGVRVEMLRHGSYKSAMEPYTLDSMSGEARENLQGVLDGWWKIVRDSVASSRKIQPKFLDSIANSPRVTASAAKKNGLADVLLYFEDVPEYVSKVLLGKEGAHFEDWPLNNDRMLQKSWMPRAKIAVLNIDGVITSGYGSHDLLFGKSIAGAQDLIDQINGLGECKALVLRINSPGGSAAASDELWHSIAKLKESGLPIIASVGDMAASGAYYAAVAADKIVAEAGSVVGSIGIYGGKVNLSGLLEKLKIKTEIVKTHESANSESTSTGFSESEREALQEYMDEFYSRFTDVVAEGRGISKERADSLGGGRVFTGAAAKENGLVDEIGGIERAIEIAREKAGIKKNARVDVEYINNFGNSFTDKLSAMAKGERQIYPWLKTLEKTQVWAVYF